MKAAYGRGAEMECPCSIPTTHAFRAVISLRAFSPGQGGNRILLPKGAQNARQFFSRGRRSSEEVSRADTLRLPCIYDVSVGSQFWCSC